VPDLKKRRMQTLLGLPLWAFGLVVAAFAPFFARAWGATVERRVRERSVRLLVEIDVPQLERGSNTRSERPTRGAEA